MIQAVGKHARDSLAIALFALGFGAIIIGCSWFWPTVAWIIATIVGAIFVVGGLLLIYLVFIFSDNVP